MYTIKEKPEDFVVKELPSFSLNDDGGYGIYKMKKYNYGTVQAVELIANFLGCKTRDIGFAGNKDKIAVTEQYISVKLISKDRVLAFKNKDISIEYIGQCKGPISLGDLRANRFEIILRNVDVIPKKKEFFINYFGEQRFSTNNVELGKLIVHKKFKEVVNLLVESHMYDYKIKEFLSKTPTDFVGAFRLLPMKTATLLISSYQSYIWNRAASKIISDLAIKNNLNMHTLNFSNQDLLICDLPHISLIGTLEMPLFGFETEEEKITPELREVLDEEKIGQRDFIIPQINYLSSGGSFRPILVPLRNLEIEKIEDKVYKICFELDKGCYATVAIRQLFV